MRAFALAGIVAASGVQAQEPSLDLVCRGKVGRNESSHTVPLPFDKADRRVDYDDSTHLRLRPDNTGEVRIPKKMQPAYKESKDGWFPLINVTRSGDLIRGKVRFHSMYKPKFQVDRVTGLLTIYGQLGDFAGDCSAFEPNEPKRKF